MGKDALLKVRVSEEEMAVYRACAAQVGLGLSEWVRMMLAGGKLGEPKKSEKASAPAGLVKDSVPEDLETCPLCDGRDCFRCPRCKGTGKIKRRV